VQHLALDLLLHLLLDAGIHLVTETLHARFSAFQLRDHVITPDGLIGKPDSAQAASSVLISGAPLKAR
jgi:hypothetical protein